MPSRIEAAIEQGEIAAARAMLEATGLAELPAQHMPIAFPLYMRGRIHEAEGHREAALEDMMACGQRLIWHGNLTPAPLPWRVHAAPLHAELGDRDEALAMATENLDLARRFGAASTIGTALHAHGAIVGGEDGIDELRQAVRVLEASPARLELAKALVALGSALRRGGQRRTAREALRRGLELAARCGARPIAARAEDELRSSGGRLLARPVTGIEALTPSEHRIAALAAEGRTNAEIAQSLFLSLKTVEMHLGRVYRKLGIRSRQQLGDVLEPRVPAQC